MTISSNRKCITEVITTYESEKPRMHIMCTRFPEMSKNTGDTHYVILTAADPSHPGTFIIGYVYGISTGCWRFKKKNYFTST